MLPHTAEAARAGFCLWRDVHERLTHHIFVRFIVLPERPNSKQINRLKLLAPEPLQRQINFVRALPVNLRDTIGASHLVIAKVPALIRAKKGGGACPLASLGAQSNA